MFGKMASQVFVIAQVCLIALDDLKPFSPQMCSILHQDNVQLILALPPIPIEIHSNTKSFSITCKTTQK